MIGDAVIAAASRNDVGAAVAVDAIISTAAGDHVDAGGTGDRNCSARPAGVDVEEP